jgi:competence protein ComEC
MRQQGQGAQNLSRSTPVGFTAAYGAGLATGLLHFGSPLGVAAFAVALALTGRPLLLLLGSAVSVGRLSGEIARVLDGQSCTVRFHQGTLRFRARVLEPVGDEGGRIPLRPITAECRGSVMARWPRRHAVAAGTEATIEGRWVPRPGIGGRPGGTLIVGGVSEASLEPTAAERLRTALQRATRTLYGARAGMVDALIVGRRGGIEPELQDLFAWSGLVHLLSISGFHIGLIGAWVILLSGAAGLDRTRAVLLAASVSVLYVAFLGWPAPATRAAALAAVLARCRIAQRHVQATPLLSATCLIVLLVDPWAILDLGGWLSAAALWGASTFSRWSDRALGPHFVWRTFSSSVGATLATAPITAAALGTVAPIGIALNFAAIPLAAIAVPGVIASLLVFPLSSVVAGALAAGAGLGLHLLELCAAAGAAVPGGHLSLEPGDYAAAAQWVAGLALGLWAIGRCNTIGETGRRIAWMATAALWLAVARGLALAHADGGPGLTLHFLDVGQGDAALIRTPSGRWVLIDAGPAGARLDAGRRVVAPFLARRGVRHLAAAVVSHAHADHLGGLPSVLGTVSATVVIEPGAGFDDLSYLGFLESLAARRIAWHAGRAGECFSLDGVRFTILHPDRHWERWGEDVNEDSLVLLVEYGAFQAIFAGDAGFPAEQAMAGALRPVDLLKVGHHGSRGSTGDDWLERLTPRVAVISVGRNDYGHPAPPTLRRLAQRSVTVRRTDQDGTVTVTTDGRSMRVQAGGETTSLAVGDDVRHSRDSLHMQSGAACRHP